MKKLIIGISAVYMIALAGSAMAQGMSHDMDHGMAMEEGHSMQQMGSMEGDMSSMGGNMKDMDHSGHGGELIHEGSVDGYQFTYHLLDIREKMAAMKAAGHAHEGMNATHHLMVYIQDSSGAPVEDAKVGYYVEGPDGATQKLMSMGMGGGYGSDVNIGEAGEYVIKTKVVAGDTKLIDSFTYSME